MCKDGQESLAEWIVENQEGINRAVLRAMKRIDGVSDALMDDGVSGEEKKHQRVVGLVMAGKSVLADYMGEEFEKEFAGLSSTLRNALSNTSYSEVRSDPDTWTARLIAMHGRY